MPPPKLRARPDLFDDPPEALPRVARQRLPLGHPRAEHGGSDREFAPHDMAPPARSLAADVVELREVAAHISRRMFDAPPPSFGLPFGLPGGRMGMLALLVILGAIVWWLFATPERTTISSFRGAFNGGSSSSEAPAVTTAALSWNTRSTRPVIGALIRKSPDSPLGSLGCVRSSAARSSSSS